MKRLLKHWLLIVLLFVSILGLGMVLVLNDPRISQQNCDRILVGMTRAEVEAILGRPQHDMRMQPTISYFGPKDRMNDDAYIRAVYGTALVYRRPYGGFTMDSITVRLQHTTSTWQKIERGMSADEEMAILGQCEQQVTGAEFFRDPRNFGQRVASCCKDAWQKCRDALP